MPQSNNEYISPGTLVTIPGYSNHAHLVYYRNGTKAATARWLSQRGRWVVSGLWNVAELQPATDAQRQDFGFDVYLTIDAETHHEAIIQGEPACTHNTSHI